MFRVGARGRLVTGSVLVSQVLAILLAGSVAAGVPPGNDDFADAVPVGPLPATRTVDTTLGTTEVGEPESRCTQTNRSVWYRITPASTRYLRIDSIGSTYDANISIWKGSSLATLEEVACSQSIDDEDFDARVTFKARADVRYFIQVVSDVPEGGDLVLHVRRVTPPPNDDLADAQRIGSLPFTATVNNINATTQPGEPRDQDVGCTSMAATRWYRFTPTRDMTLRADTFGSAPIDTVLAVFTGSSLASLVYRACDDDVIQAGLPTHESSATWKARAGVRYYLQVGGIVNHTGPIDLLVRRVTPPANDEFASATALGALPETLAAGNRNATHQANEPTASCGDPLDQTRWYRSTPGANDPLRAKVDGEAGLSPYVAIYTGGSLGTLVEVACGPSADFTPTPGTTYRFQVASGSGASGPITFTLEPT